MVDRARPQRRTPATDVAVDRVHSCCVSAITRMNRPPRRLRLSACHPHSCAITLPRDACSHTRNNSAGTINPTRFAPVVALDVPGGIAEQLARRTARVSETPRGCGDRSRLVVRRRTRRRVALRQRILSEIAARFRKRHPTEFPLEGADKLVLIAVRRAVGRLYAHRPRIRRVRPAMGHADRAGLADRGDCPNKSSRSCVEPSRRSRSSSSTRRREARRAQAARRRSRTTTRRANRGQRPGEVFLPDPAPHDARRRARRRRHPTSSVDVMSKSPKRTMTRTIGPSPKRHAPPVRRPPARPRRTSRHRPARRPG